MRLAAKMLAATLLPLLVLIEVAGWSLTAVNRLVRTNDTIVTRTLPALRDTSLAAESLNALVRHHARWVLLRDPAYSRLWSARADEFERRLAALATSGSPRASTDLRRKCQAAFRRYRSLVAERQPDGTERLRVLPDQQLRAARRVADRLMRGVRQLGATFDAAAEDAHRRAGALERRTWRTVLVALPLSAALAIVLSFLVAVRVTRVLRRLATASAELAQGTLAEPVRVNRRDELGDLGRAFNAMAGRLGELDRMKEQVFSHLSHELRTPLTSIREATHLLADGVPGPLTQRQGRLVTIIGDSTNRLLGMVNRILDYSRMRAGLQPLEHRPVKLRTVASRALHELRVQADAARVRVEESGNGADPLVLGDEERLVEAVMNLVSNAIKASPPGQTVRVAIQDDGTFAAVVVADHGAGIPRDAMGRIFEPYVQAPGAPAGTGLGLAIVKSIVEAHRGEIRVESEEGQGSAFTVRLPRAHPVATERAS